MSRLENKAVMGYFPLETHHHPTILSLIAPASPSHRLLDPFAGEGEFLEVAAKAWNLTPYANELDGERAARCIERFGPKQAVRCDVERLSASLGAFSIAWLNPPYDHDAAAKNSKRVEFVYLRHSWKWLCDGGIGLWCVYQQHLTEEALAFLARNSSQVEVWGLPGKHLGEYQQVIVVAIKTGHQPDPETLYQQLLTQKVAPTPLTILAEPRYSLPPPPKLNRFIFAPDLIDEEHGLQLIEDQGAWKTQGFQALLEVPPPPTDIVPPVAPRPGHIALVLAAGIADGAVIESPEYGQVALRGKTQPVEVIARQEITPDERDPDHVVKKTTLRLKPTTVFTLLAQDGTIIEMAGDEALLGFIRSHRAMLAAYLNQRFQPLYDFKLNGLGNWLKGIKLNGKYPLYLAQQHVIAALTRAFEDRDRLLLIGSMGVGKTAMGSSTAIALASGVVQALKRDIRPDQVTLIICPPHLIEKWKRELASIAPKAFIQRLDRHEAVKAFMLRAAELGGNIPKIGLIKRDLTKLGTAWEPAVIWRKVGKALWHHQAATPLGYEQQQRVIRQRVPLCPVCGNTIQHTHKRGTEPASESWLSSGKRDCDICHTPLWQDARDTGSRLKPGEKYPTKNPRIRLDQYLKRQYPDRVYLMIWDEAHECQASDTGNGQSFGRMAGIARKVLAMTGTPFNGRSSSLFNLEYHLNERVRQQYNWGGAPRFARKIPGSRNFPEVLSDSSRQRGRAESRWVDRMGVREQVIEERPTYDHDTGAFTGTTTYERPYEESPGISPLLVAEVLDHAVFFALGDLGKALPDYQEIALPVEADPDIAETYTSTLLHLKDYLIQRRWEGDSSFRGAYLQWAMSWVNTPHLPYAITHNLKDAFTGKARPSIVRHLSALDDQRIYAKEQVLLDLVRAELAANRPCVIYVRQTQTRDLQPRLMALLQTHLPDAKPYILKNTIAAERREAVITQQVNNGINILITNPELTKTGLDLLFAPTLIFYEPTWNLSTMMQAAARSYRLNQTHALCKVVYLFYTGTMEHHAVQLMSRKQRAAKLLNGEIGLSGLDALTEGEAGLEESLLAAIGSETALLDPTQLFQQDEIDAEDAHFWNIDAPEAISADPLLTFATQELHASITEVMPSGLEDRIRQCLIQHTTLPAARLTILQQRLLSALETKDDPETLSRWITKYLRVEKAVPHEQLAATTAALVALVSPPPIIVLPTTSRPPKTISLDHDSVPEQLTLFPTG